MSHVDAHNILNTLRARHAAGGVYANVGTQSIVLSLNPYTWRPQVRAAARSRARLRDPRWESLRGHQRTSEVISGTSSEGVDRGCVPSLPRDCPPKDADLYAVNTMHEYYQNLAFGTRALPPHIFAIASDAYRALLLHGTSQSIVTSGESGSGTRWPVRHGRWVAVGKG